MGLVFYRRCFLALTVVGTLFTIMSGLPVKAEKPVFQLGVSTTQYLPPPMYGTWQVRATLVGSSNNAVFPPMSEDIWTLAQDGQTVTLSNPTTGAVATIAVNEVQGNLARFTHRAQVGRTQFIEENPSVMVEADRLFGQTKNRLLVRRNGVETAMYTATYRIEAVRIGGGRIRFGQSDPDPQFDIEPIQPLRSSPSPYPFYPVKKPAANNRVLPAKS